MKKLLFIYLIFLCPKVNLPVELTNYPKDPFGKNPEFVTVESDIGWVEGPAWVPEEQGFIYNLSDRNTPDIHRIWRPKEESSSEYWRVSGSNHGAIWSNGLIYLTNREPGRISYIDPSQTPLKETVIRDGLGRPNDLDRFSDGSLFFSDWPKGGRDGVYRLKLNGDIEQILNTDQIKNPNGLAFTADCKCLYIANSGINVMAFDVDENGNLSNQRVFITIKNANGIAVDVAGNLYVPASNTGIDVYSSEGEKIGNWPGPQRVVNMTFGGEDNQWLLTTNNGGVTAVRTRIPGAECNGLLNPNN